MLLIGAGVYVVTNEEPDELAKEMQLFLELLRLYIVAAGYCGYSLM